MEAQLKIMVDLQPEQNEHIIRRTKEAWRFDGDEEQELQSLVLTNKHLISVYEKPTALFFNEKTVVDKKPLSLICIIDGVLQVQDIMDDNFGESLQILYDNGAEELYFFGDAPQSEYRQWEKAIKKAVIENKKTVIESGEITDVSLSVKENKQDTPIVNNKEKVHEKSNMAVLCKKCGAENNADARFCQNCGTLLSANDKAVEKQPEYILCKNCGTENNANAKFCQNCGVFLEDHNKSKQPEESYCNKEQGQQSTYSERKQEYAGKIIKCPNCGENLSSFIAICPVCGHEINSAKVSSTMRDFTNQINSCDIAIANSLSEPKTGWKSWGKWKKIGWVILNIYTLCIPLVIYMLLPLAGVVRLSSLSPEEKTKAQLINNFPFPNDRESILEALLYIKAQIAILASGKIDRNTSCWVVIWKNKADQLFEKAEIMFKEDKIANNAYSAILASEKKVKKVLFMKAILVAIMVAVYIGFIFFRSDAGQSVMETTSVFEWPTSGLALQIPKPPSNKGKITFNDEDSFWVNVYDIDQRQYESYVHACEEMGYIVDSKKYNNTYEAYNENGNYIQVMYFSSNTDLTIQVEAPEPMGEINWPKSNIAKRLPVPKSSYGNIYWEADYGFVIYLGNTTKQDFSEYADACYDMGFTTDYERGDTYFRADDSEGYQVDVEYRGNDIMFIRIDEPD